MRSLITLMSTKNCHKTRSGLIAKTFPSLKLSLQAGVGMRMDARFDERFEIEEHFEEGCVYDWLQVITYKKWV